MRKSLDNKRKEYYKSLVFIVAQDVEEKRGKDLVSYNGVDIKIIPFADLKESLSSTEELNTSKYKALENIKDRAKRDLFSKRVTLFLGAGVSASAGIPSWNTLIEQLCVKNNIDKIDSDVENIVKGRRIVLCYGDNIDDLRRDIKQILYHNCQSTSSLLQSISKIIDETDVESVITYNYDDLLEIVAEKNNKKKCCSIYKNSRTLDKDFIPVYHVHGYIPKEINDEHIETEIILGEKEYHNIYVDSFNWGNVEQLHALTRNTCFFIGMSMCDPNIRRLLDISISGDVDITDRPHYVFLRKIDYDVNFTERIMHSFGVNCIWYNQHDELPIILKKLLKQEQ